MRISEFSPVKTREILFGQLQDGLMKSPAVSGCQSYQDLKVAAKNEEKRLIELRRRQRYLSSQSYHQNSPRKPKENAVNPSQAAAVPRRVDPHVNVTFVVALIISRKIVKLRKRKALFIRTLARNHLAPRWYIWHQDGTCFY